METARRYYTTFEASHLLGVSLPTVVNWIKAARLKAHRTPGGHRRIAREDLASFIRRHAMPMPSELAEEGASARILLVHGEGDEGEALEELLRQSGYECARASNGFAAGLAIGDYKPDLVIIELGLSGLDGMRVVSELRGHEATCQLPVIALSSGRDDKLLRRVLAAGFDDLLPRPFDHAALRRRVDNALRTRRAA